jgi:hypothetical protein
MSFEWAKQFVSEIKLHSMGATTVANYIFCFFN